MNKPHVHAEVIKAWADGAEIEECVIYDQDGNPTDSGWQKPVANTPKWHSYIAYRIKPQPVIKKMYMHYDSIERYVKDIKYDGANVPQQMWAEERAMGNHLEFTFTDGKLTSVEIVK